MRFKVTQATKHVSPPRQMSNMQMEGKSAGVYGFMVSIFALYLPLPRDPTLRRGYHPCCVCVMMATGCCYTHGFNPWKHSKHPLCCRPVLSTRHQTLAYSVKRGEPEGCVRLASRPIRRSAGDEELLPLTASLQLNCPVFDAVYLSDTVNWSKSRRRMLSGCHTVSKMELFSV